MNSIPEGWKLVPVEPTLEMIAAMGFDGCMDTALGHAELCAQIEESYCAMLAAAPEPPVVKDSLTTEPVAYLRKGDLRRLYSKLSVGGAFLGEINAQPRDDLVAVYEAPQPSPGVAELVEALEGLLDIIADSRGVVGYHLNGNIAKWDEFEEVEIAEEVVAVQRQGGDK